MPLHTSRAMALLAWVNSLKVDSALDDLAQLQDCSVFIKIINKIHDTEEGESALQQPLPERIAFICSFLQKHCKHKATMESLVSVEKLLEGEELELAKVTVLLLYHTSISIKSPKDWNEFEYKIQVELATILKFVLDNEEGLSENLEIFLQKRASSCSVSSSSSEEHSPMFSRQHPREVRFLELQKIASSSSLNNFLPGMPASPMGDILQTPQFQLRRLKKQLVAERENRDELELELAENRKLLTEKETQITMLQQRIDRLTLLNERQAAEQLEPKELEELREKNESLMMRLHEALKQCQDLRTEKGQMDRKITQLSEENGDLSFKLREFASHLMQLQEALNELSEEHSAALTQGGEKQTHLESELHSAIQEKKCLEEKIEILQGKISLLEDQLAKLGDGAMEEKGEVMGDVLKLEDLKQEVASLTAKVIELQATILRLEEEKSLHEANLQTEQQHFKEEKAQLMELIGSLQSSVSEIHQAKEKLEQDSREQEARLTTQVNTLTAEIAKLNAFVLQKEQELMSLHQQVQEERTQKGQLAEDLQKQEQSSRETIQGLSLQVDQLSSTLRHNEEKLLHVTQQMEVTSQGEARQLAALREEHEKALHERELAVLQLQEFQQGKEAELAALATQLQTLEKARDTGQASVLELQREKAQLGQRVQDLDARVLELTAKCQQSEVQAAAAESLKAQLREVETKLKEGQQKLLEKEKLAKENARLQERLLFLEESVRNTEGILEDEKRRASETLEGNLARINELETEIQKLSEHRDQMAREVGEEKAKGQALERQLQELGEEYGEKMETLQRQLVQISSVAKGDEGAREQLKEQVRALSKDHQEACRQLQKEQGKVAELEERIREQQERLALAHSDLAGSLARFKEKESVEQKLKANLSSLQEKMAASDQETAQRVAQLQAEVRKMAGALEGVTKELSEERLRKTELEAKVKRLREQKSKDLTMAEADLARASSVTKEKELEAEKLSGEVKRLNARLEETLQAHKHELALRDKEAEHLAQEMEQAKADLAAEKAGKAELDVQLQNTLNEQRTERATHQEELARSLELIEEKEGELEELRLKNVSRGEELRDLQKTVNKLKGELASVEALKERAAKMESELQGFLEVARTREAEIDSIKSIVYSKEMSLKSLEEKIRHREQESSSCQDLYQEKLKETEVLNSEVQKLEQKCREQQDTITSLERAAAETKAMTAKHQEAELEALREIGQQKAKVSELEKLLEASKSTQAGQGGTIETLKKELLEKGKELSRSREAITAAEKELASLRSSAQEKSKSEESWKEQVSQCLQEVERKNSLISSLQQERSIFHRQAVEKEAESKELKRLITAESEKSRKLEERLRILQTEMATAASRAAERCSIMKAEVQSYQEETEKQKASIDALKRQLNSQGERQEELRAEVKAWQEKYFQKEQLLSPLQQELAKAQALVGELMPMKRLYQQQQVEQSSLESKHREELEQRQRAASTLQAELAKAKLELAEVRSVKERFSEQDRAVQRLQVENASYLERLAVLQQANARLAEENRGLSEKSSHGRQKFDAELSQLKEKHAQELERLKLDSGKLVAGSKQEAEEAVKKLEAMTNKYENAKVKVLEERQKFQEERQKLVSQVEQLEVFQKEQAKQVEELNKKVAQHERVTRAQQQKVKVLEGELQEETSRQQEKISELQEQLAQKEQAAEHYKAQMEKAKTFYDAKKQQNQDLAEKLKGLEQLQMENTELKAESERLAKELQQTVLQAKESELSCRNLSSQVRSLEAQVEFADRQLRELGKSQVAADPLKSRDPFSQHPGDISTDSLDLSSDELQPLNSTRKPGRSKSETSAVPDSAESITSQRLPRKVESLESLYFTPIPSRTQSKLESSLGSLGELSLDSGCKTRSARRRTTQIINITMRKKEPDSAADTSFYSLRSEPSQKSPLAKGRLRSGVSTRSLTSCPSRESLTKPEATSPEETPGNSALLNLPGYRPATRSSLRRSQAGSSTSLGRSSLYLGTCQDEPEQLDDWNRIAELQQRNRVCPPHLKTCYPLETRPSSSLTAITDEDVKTGDPQETLRRASMQPSQIAEAMGPRHSTLGASWRGGITTRQQRKRLSGESHQGPDTPESKKSTSCFPRPQTPKDRNEERKRSTQGSKKSELQGASKQSERRQSMAFSILNTPKKLGSSLLRRGANRKTTPKNSPRGSTRRSPRIATAKSPKGKANHKSLKDMKF
ncbi:PREDICTED: nuclear mitotic apparatus protein 1 isoform X3 [Gavialis gangeticus]|uniref:nuclear mitotic apparatus protein 1 isoform X1 n=1 Tax=Gavialis gangeticus TaxID=94835 RepID=UPI00092FA836|nr:PREDICTED: nuclear mitotic apparatus protein 1 isoform X1 [Gavialis gangeticus]XP_019379851.1 PREDICTED: nuclear mitotic apparatus protein 1 isoform X1 [Gavialis gangeticus]XP_019379852.1 PREDICTED: nuclear mitotic apparatus protein 1 isoform X1 [Gavialis gangeticus]XP_019379853.1 PREDICTED: nuclear mitotic apparatus protein 1 isoform X1 [Gavialis gangeticus]XP_019379856.1 PREDICTED: nuclear mitotic apparatus protein 1 isoform X3 [Gavialis gangeticus]